MYCWLNDSAESLLKSILDGVEAGYRNNIFKHLFWNTSNGHKRDLVAVPQTMFIHVRLE